MGRRRQHVGIADQNQGRNLDPGQVRARIDPLADRVLMCGRRPGVLSLAPLADRFATIRSRPGETDGPTGQTAWSPYRRSVLPASERSAPGVVELVRGCRRAPRYRA